MNKFAEIHFNKIVDRLERYRVEEIDILADIDDLKAQAESANFDFEQIEQIVKDRIDAS